MDIRWFIDNHEDGKVEVEILPNGNPMLYRSMWVHDCVELDRKNRVATYREQLDTISDMPTDWQAEAVNLERIASRWHALVSQQERERWVHEQEGAVNGLADYAARFPGELATRQLEDGKARLQKVIALQPGWVPLASEVSRVLDEQFGDPVECKRHGTADPNEPIKLDIRNKDIIDWYDGVLSALLELGNEAVPHLCLCVAWSPEYDERVYGLVPVTGDVTAKLRNLLGRSPSGEHWSEITRIMSDAVSGHVGSITVVATDDRFKEVLGRTTVPSGEVCEIGFGERWTMEPCDDHRLFTWLGRLGLPKPLSWREKEGLESHTEPDETHGGKST
jgi:hypothetical protein